MKNYFLKTFGCQMNTYDSELIQTILNSAGFQLVTDFKQADVILFNTCAVRESAENKVFGQINEIKNQLKPKDVLYGLLGCMTKDHKEELLNNKKAQIDFIVSPDNYKDLPKIIKNCYKQQQKIAILTESTENYEDVYPTHIKGASASVAIMRGCDNFCSYCIVPYTRGREKSRSLENIVTEIKKLVLEGFKEVVLLGQNVNSYKYENYDFTDLLQKISLINELKRIRFVSPHPKDFPLKLLELMRNRENICKSLHLPLQSGSSEILKKMNRGYTKENYLRLVDQIKSIMPNITLTTDIIVGFPFEEEEDFQATIEVMKKVQFDSAFIFKYSPRKYTLAYKKYPNNISSEIKKQRIMELNNLQNQISYQKNSAYINTNQIVLIEEKGVKKNPTAFCGRTNGNKLVIIKNNDYKIGDLVEVKITSASANVLIAE